MSCLQLDAGNTRLKWRLVSVAASASDEPLARGSLVWRNFPSPERLLAELFELLAEVMQESVTLESVLVVSVAGGAVDQALATWSRQSLSLEAQFARVSRQASGIAVGYDDPGRLGVDRWLAVLAAAKFGSHVVVVDCGSAVTVDILQRQQHQGGYIVPGLRLMNAALFQQTAQVQVVDHWLATGAPGRNTSDAVNSGIPLMVAGLVREVVLRCQSEVSAGEWQVVLTGGDAPLIAKLLEESLSGMSLTGIELRRVDDLVLDGLPLAQCGCLADGGLDSND